MNFSTFVTQGADVSFYQDDNTTPQKINFDKMVEQGADFVIIRAGQNAWIDPDFSYNWPKAKQSGLPRGAYWFYDSRYDPIKQAELFASLFVDDKPELRLWLDLEENYGGFYKGHVYWKRFLVRLRELLPSVMIGIYTGYYFISGKIPTSEHTFFKQFPLWLAWYTTNPEDVLVPIPWTSVEFWQWGTPTWGIAWGCESIEIDMNRYNGSKQEMLSAFGLSEISTSEYLFGGALRYEKRVLTSPRSITCHIAEIDLSKARFVVTPPKPNGLLNPTKTSSFAKEFNTDLSINADEGYPAGNNEFTLIRRQMSMGVKYGTQTDGITLSVSKDRAYQLSMLSASFPSFAWNAVSGSKWLVKDGVIGNFVNDLPPDPRTLIGYTKDNKKMFWVVIDGRGTSQGMTLLESALLMIDLGCWQANNLDGGGSSTMVIKHKGIVNQPSDATGERLVANHIGVIFDGGTMAKNKVTVTWDTGARERKTPSVNSPIVGNVLLDNSVHYSDFDVVNDLDDPNNPDKKWIQLQSSWYIATRYPSSIGIVERAIVEPVIIPPPSNKDIIEFTWDNNHNLIGITVNGVAWVKP